MYTDMINDAPCRQNPKHGVVKRVLGNDGLFQTGRKVLVGRHVDLEAPGGGGADDGVEAGQRRRRVTTEAGALGEDLEDPLGHRHVGLQHPLLDHRVGLQQLLHLDLDRLVSLAVHLEPHLRGREHQRSVER